MSDDTASRKRKLPEWMLLPSIEEEEEEEEPEKKRRRDAQRALVILEEGLARAQIKAREDELLATDDISTENDDDPESAFFQLSQSSVVDEMTTDEALALVGECKNKDDRKQLICDLKAALREF